MKVKPKIRQYNWHEWELFCIFAPVSIFYEKKKRINSIGKMIWLHGKPRDWHKPKEGIKAWALSQETKTCWLLAIVVAVAFAVHIKCCLRFRSILSFALSSRLWMGTVQSFPSSITSNLYRCTTGHDVCVCVCVRTFAKHIILITISLIGMKPRRLNKIHSYLILISGAQCRTTRDVYSVSERKRCEMWMWTMCDKRALWRRNSFAPK